MGSQFAANPTLSMITKSPLNLITYRLTPFTNLPTRPYKGEFSIHKTVGYRVIDRRANSSRTWILAFVQRGPSASDFRHFHHSNPSKKMLRRAIPIGLTMVVKDPFRDTHAFVCSIRH
ncbi:uncharacterized protein ARMOST_02585 [Armillaria ostoyae]|uniref:Uncharacterized protein n=1 Tax=Armillaria ostoyae TaxID=47428 RepID=A0A284QS38_ARMOS|nr:uncharacterized protein ARMOST_02585 [Armillaria ostoyae]